MDTKDVPTDASENSSPTNEKMQEEEQHSSSLLLLSGREVQEEQLLEAFERRTANSDNPIAGIDLITGPSGTGKTLLALSLKRRVQAQRGYFCCGKSDQIQHCNQPFAPFRQAVTQLVDTVLLQGNVDCSGEVERLEEAVETAIQDADFSLLTSLFPVFEKVHVNHSSRHHQSHSHFSYHHHKSSREFSLHSASREFSLHNASFSALNNNNNNPIQIGVTSETPAILVFCQFLQAFCSPQHPTVFLMDDLQWFDKHSLELLSSLAAAEISGFMLLGTCRGNEVSLSDQLSVVLRELEEQQNVLITDIQLQGLSLEGVQQMVTETLELPKSRRQSARVVSLAQFLLQRTGGNPFYIQQTIRTLCNSDLISRDTYTDQWNWDLQAMEGGEELEQTQVLDQAIQAIANQSPIIEETLIVASFLGAGFSMKHVHVAMAKDCGEASLEDIKDALSTLTKEGLVEPQEDGQWYRWTHDQFQNSANSLVPESQQKEKSLKIGRQLLDKLSPMALEQQRFLVANLLLEGFDLLVQSADPKERVIVARVLHLAGSKAAFSSAFDAAAFFFSKGIELLSSGNTGKEVWDKHYDLCLELYNGALEMESCTGRHQKSDELFEIVLQNARCLQDQLRAYEAKLLSLSARHMDDEGVVLGFQVLQQLGEPMPRIATKLHSGVAIVRTLWLIRGMNVESIRKRQLPEIQRWDKRAALRILQLMTANLIRATPAHGAVWAARCVQLTIRYGFSPMAAPSFCGFGFILATVLLGLKEEAKRCTAIAHEVFQQFYAPEWRCRMMIFEYSYVQPWHLPFKECLPNLLTATTVGLLGGDVHSAYIGITFYGIYGLCTSIPLNDLIAALEQRYKEFRNLNQKMLFIGFSLQLAERFFGSGKGESFDIPFSTYCDRELAKDEAENKRKDPALMIVCYSCQLMHAVYTNNWSEGMKPWKPLRWLPYNELYSITLAVQIHFLVGMVEVMAYQESKAFNGRGLLALKKLKGWQKKMAVQLNVRNKVNLLEAERAVCRGKRQLAREKFLASIHAAKQSGFTHEHALAHERFASALSTWGYHSESLDHIKEAATLYHEWGFHTKAKDLEQILEQNIEQDRNNIEN